MSMANPPLSTQDKPITNYNEALNSQINNTNQQNIQHPQQLQPPPSSILNQNPPNESNNTGVSNGDVDWLFRGKSKKLAKKQTSNVPTTNNNGNNQSSNTKPNGNINEQSEDRSKDVAKKQEHSENLQQKQSQQTPPQEPIQQQSKHIKHNNEESSTSTKQPEKTSKLDKLIGRSRSSSASNVTQQQQQQQQQQQPAKRRTSSFNIAPSLTSDLVYNDHDEALLAQRKNVSTPNSSTTSSPSISRSNSKKGLFSSITSKFKSPQHSQPQQSQQQHHQQQKQQQSQSIPSSPKLNPNLIGSASNPKRDEDLVSQTDKPPAGIPTRRRSLNNQKPNNNGGLFKESYQDENPVSASPNDSLNFFRRRSSAAKINHNNTMTLPPRVILNKNNKRVKLPLKDLKDVKIQRVTFAINQLEYDPQQQIPSRRPKKGNVLIPQDLNAPPPRVCLGIAVSSEKDGNDKTNTTTSSSQYSEKEISMAYEAQKRALAETEKHQCEAHLRAKRIAMEVANFKNIKSKQLSKENEIIIEQKEEEEEEADIDSKVSKKFINDARVDQPLHFHEQHFENENEPERNSSSEKGSSPSLETIYTRCCHLREILPIPATLKQLKNKTAPLEVLKMLNPKPTLIDILSFSDFIAIIPINTVIFDNVTLTTEMLKIILGSLIKSNTLEKLSLRNVAIDHFGWKLLCTFLAVNKTVKKLDISQQRIKSETSSDCIRGNLNWDLIIESLCYRNGIEELVINGCKLSDEVFHKLINKAVKIGTRRLGVANIEMNINKAQMVADYVIDPESNCVGIDIAFNDLSQGQLKPFINAFNNGHARLMFLSINSTNLCDVEEASEFLKSLINVRTLRFLDLSSIPKIFPEIISSLDEYLPQYGNLRRLHLDLNELTAKGIGSIASFLSKVPHLVHLSLLGNKNLTHSVAATLYSAVKQSTTLFALDLDYDLIGDEISQRIAFYLMRNMDQSLNSQYPSEFNDNAKEEDLMFDGSLLMESAEKLLSEVDQHDKLIDLKIQQIISNAMLEKTKSIRKEIHTTIDGLFAKRSQNNLSFEGKENLVRFCLLDSTLEKLVQMLESVQNHQHPEKPNEKTTTENGNHYYDDTIHQSSHELITAGPILSPRSSSTFPQLTSYFPGNENNNNLLTPHQVVVEPNSEGKDIIIDKFTGRPVLMRSNSQASLHAKEQEIEEGEFHKFGLFMQSRNDEELNKKDFPLLNTLPSGSELRDAIIKAKGIENVNDLIDRINKKNTNNNPIVSRSNSTENVQEQQRLQQSQQELQNQYQHQQQSTKHSIPTSPTFQAKRNNSNDDTISETGSIESEIHQPNAMVDEVYEKLLNHAEKTRSNKLE